MLFVVIAAVAFLAYYTYNYSKGERKSRFIWDITLSEGEREPYDLGSLKKMLRNETKGEFRIVENDNLVKELKYIQPGDSFSYFYIGQYFYVTGNEVNELLRFAETGHQVFIVAEQIPDTLFSVMQSYSKPLEPDYLYKSRVTISFANESGDQDSFNFGYRYYNKSYEQPVYWPYLSENKQLSYYYDDARTGYIEMGRINGKLNFVKFKVGAGEIYYHTNPLLFTNYFLNNETGLKHASHVFSELNTNNLLYDIAAREYKDDSKPVAKKSPTPISYILSKPPLKWAWYLLMAGILLFFLFKAKREQRIMPVLERKRNTTLSFIDTITGLYFSNRDHKRMAIIKMQLFQVFIRNKLGFSTNEVNEETIRLIAQKANVPIEHTRIIFEYYDQVIKPHFKIDDIDLINLNQYIETFYKYYNAKQ